MKSMSLNYEPSSGRDTLDPAPQPRDSRHLGPQTLLFHRKCSSCRFARSQFPHKHVNLSFIMTNVQIELTDLCGQNDFTNTFCGINLNVPDALSSGFPRDILSEFKSGCNVYRIELQCVPNLVAM